MANIADSRISEIIKTSRPLFPGDTVTRAVSLIRASGGSAVPVVDAMRVVGIVRESDLLPLIADASSQVGFDPEKLPPVVSIMSPNGYSIAPNATIGEAVRLFNETGVEVLPVVTENGGYIGYLSRADVTATLSHAIRPPMVGGLATPLGVHLTCGSQRGGVGDKGLVMMGMLFSLLQIGGLALATLIAYGIETLFGPPAYAALLSEPTSVPNLLDAIPGVVAIIPIATLLLGIRLLPVAGYHAAEHQTVHAIEQGEPLDFQTVSRMPRVHQRCGTNLAAAAAIFIFLISQFPSPFIVVVAMMAALLGWRSIGAFLQRHVTTKPASRRQIESGIQAGNELLRNYREELAGQRAPGRRIWNLGFIQMGIGLMIPITIVYLLIELTGVRIPFL